MDGLWDLHNLNNLKNEIPDATNSHVDLIHLTYVVAVFKIWLLVNPIGFEAGHKEPQK